VNIKFINIPSNLLFDTNVSSFAKLLYGELYVLSYKKGVCEVSNHFLANANSCSTRKIIRALNNLKECGYISIIEYPTRKIYIGMTELSPDLWQKCQP